MLIYNKVSIKLAKIIFDSHIFENILALLTNNMYFFFYIYIKLLIYLSPF